MPTSLFGNSRQVQVAPVWNMGLHCPDGGTLQSRATGARKSPDAMFVPHVRDYGKVPTYTVVDHVFSEREEVVDTVFLSPTLTSSCFFSLISMAKSKNHTNHNQGTTNMVS